MTSLREADILSSPSRAAIESHHRRSFEEIMGNIDPSGYLGSMAALIVDRYMRTLRAAERYLLDTYECDSLAVAIAHQVLDRHITWRFAQSGKLSLHLPNATLDATWKKMKQHRSRAHLRLCGVHGLSTDHGPTQCPAIDLQGSKLFSINDARTLIKSGFSAMSEERWRVSTQSSVGQTRTADTPGSGAGGRNFNSTTDQSTGFVASFRRNKSKNGPNGRGKGSNAGATFGTAGNVQGTSKHNGSQSDFRQGTPPDQRM
jgi:hypothetical protein